MQLRGLITVQNDPLTRTEAVPTRQLHSSSLAFFSAFLRVVGAGAELVPVGIKPHQRIARKNLYHDALFTKEDAEALRNDWEQIGEDIERAIHEYRATLSQSEQEEVDRLVETLERNV